MAVKPVSPFPSPLLRAPTVDVGEVTDEVRAFCRDLADTMEAATAAGIAAPQIGAMARVFVISKHVAKADEHVVFINPKLVEVGAELQVNREGCLSFPGVFLDVQRPKTVKVEYTDTNGAQQTVEAESYYAQAILHEYDHLEGKLLIDYAGPVRRDMMRRKARKYRGKLLDYRLVRPDAAE